MNDGFGTADWFRGSRDPSCSDVLCDYLHAFYWSSLALTTIGDLPRPRTRSEYFYLITQVVFGLFLFAAVLGHVANIVTNVSAARKEFQGECHYFFYARGLIVRLARLGYGSRESSLKSI